MIVSCEAEAVDWDELRLLTEMDWEADMGVEVEEKELLAAEE